MFLVPKTDEFLMGKWAPLGVLLQKLTEQTIEHLTDIDPTDLEHVTIEVTCGLDGSGRHKVHRSSKTDSDSIVYGGIRLYRIKGCNDVILYEEESMHSDTEIPWYLVPGQEKRTLVEKLIKRMEKEAQKCCNCGLTISVKGKQISVKPVIRLTQGDGKVVKTITGLGGAFCTMCLATLKDAHDLDFIKDGFKIVRSMEQVSRTYNKLVDEDRFDKASSAVRSGITNQPLITDFFQPIRILPVLHAKINSLKWWEKFAYSFNARGAFENNIPIRGQGKRKSTEQTQAVDNSEYEFKREAKRQCNLPLDMPDASGAGGNTGIYFSFILG